jgi:DNA-binding response OmpR family regulator
MERQKRILVADDSSLVRQVIQKILSSRKDYAVYGVASGTECLKVADEWLPDLILLDILMPEKDGYETCQELLSSKKTAEVPVIFLSSLTDTDDKVRGLELGAVDFISKPVQKAELLARVNTHLRLASLQHELQAASEEYKALVHVLCHDMGNYLTNVYSFSDLINGLNETDFQKVKVYNQRIYSSAERAVQFLRDIREFEAARSNKFRPQTSKVSILNMLKQCFNVFENKLKDKNLKLDFSQVKEELCLQVDPHWFVMSVLNNLISNSIKFSYPEAKITVSACSKLRFTELIIEDSGMGISPYVLQSLFSTSGTTTPGTAGETGTGFGMPLVKRWVENFNGTIEVESRHYKEFPDNHGTRFILRFPPCV